MDETRAPAPLEWHPAYRDKTWLLDWLNGQGSNVIQLPIPTRWAATMSAYDTVQDVPSIRPMTMTRRKCAGPAPYVGRRFIYTWFAGVDDLGRTIASDSECRYDPLDFAPGWEHYASLPEATR